MSQTIPTSDLPFYSLRTRLDERDYTFKFNYSTRQSRWYLSIYDVENVLLVAGLKLVANFPLLKYYKFRDGMPQGDLIVMCTTADTAPPTLNELGPGLRCELTYYPQAELEALAAELFA